MWQTVLYLAKNIYFLGGNKGRDTKGVSTGSIPCKTWKA